MKIKDLIDEAEALPVEGRALWSIRFFAVSIPPEFTE